MRAMRMGSDPPKAAGEIAGMLDGPLVGATAAESAAITVAAVFIGTGGHSYGNGGSPVVGGGGEGASGTGT